MDLKGTLKAITLEIRHELEGRYDAQGKWQAGDLERRLGEIGVWRDRPEKPADELTYRSPEDREARRVVGAFLETRIEAGLDHAHAVQEFVMDAAYTWANRLLALRCMEARNLIDEVILQKDAYGGRSLQHHRLATNAPERCAGEDEGIFAALFDEFERRAKELPLLFNPNAPEVALRPSVAALKRCIGLFSGTISAKGQEGASDEVFTAPDALGWAYQYWNTEEKARVFEKVRTKKGAKIEGPEIIPATCIYTEPYMVKFLVQNSLGAMWMQMHPESRLAEGWDYYVRDANRTPVPKRAVIDITFLDPASGSGHFLTEAFDLFYSMYEEDGQLTDPSEICAAILDHNLYGIDIDERAIEIAAVALVMKAKEKARDFIPRRVNLVATNIRLPAGKEHLEAFLRKHPEDVPLKPALLAIFEGLDHVDELGSLLQIEEPVDQELRHLRDQQLDRERKAGAGTLSGPHREEDWVAWKENAIGRLRAHFGSEIDAPDLETALFGGAAGKGLSLVDMLAHRYDVVAANPPYMGSKNMGSVLRRYLDRHFSAGKRDVYAAFILRCLQLSSTNGRVAFVAPQPWMFLRSYATLRAVEETSVAKGGKTVAGILRACTVEALAQLGRHAFDEADPPSNVALCVLAASRPTIAHRARCYRLAAPMPASEQASLLRDAIAGYAPNITFNPVQARFLSIPQTPFCYWLRERFLELLGGQILGSVAAVCQGLVTGQDERAVRFAWELPSTSMGWVPHTKGGGYGRWKGNDRYVVDWRDGGKRVELGRNPRFQNVDWYFKKGLWYSRVARKAIGARELSADAVIGVNGPGIFVKDGCTKDWPIEGLHVILNCRFATYLTRAIAQSIVFQVEQVSRLPLPSTISVTLPDLQRTLVALKDHLLRRDLNERSFFGVDSMKGRARSLSEAYRAATDESEAVAAVLHTLEGISERQVFTMYGFDSNDIESILKETGTPAGFGSLLAGYDSTPPVPRNLLVPCQPSTPPSRIPLTDELTAYKQRLRSLYNAGPGATEGDAETESEDSYTETADDPEDEDDVTSGSGVHIPTETFVDELAQKIELHPISVYWLLREMREAEGLVCPSELRRFTEDCLSIMVLRLVGHRWPREVGTGEPAPAWADVEGVIPIIGGTGEPALLTRVREEIAKDFGPHRVTAIEQEFAAIIGKPLVSWLAVEFFKRHISQFKKRPIAWQIQSGLLDRRARIRGKKKGGAQRGPAFSCLILCHHLDVDLFPTVQTHHVRPLRSRLQTELNGLEKVHGRTADQDARRVELEQQIEELKDFDARLDEVIANGFACAPLDAIGAKEELDSWVSRDGRLPAPDSRADFVGQERRYDPDLNDGVRVNIAPLQRAGLLAADVLAPKDVEEAIADRAEWRADERRWCREGKLPQPGWWPAEIESSPQARDIRSRPRKH